LSFATRPALFTLQEKVLFQSATWQFVKVASQRQVMSEPSRQAKQSFVV